MKNLPFHFYLKRIFLFITYHLGIIFLLNVYILFYLNHYLSILLSNIFLSKHSRKTKNLFEINFYIESTNNYCFLSETYPIIEFNLPFYPLDHQYFYYLLLGTFSLLLPLYLSILLKNFFLKKEKNLFFFFFFYSIIIIFHHYIKIPFLIKMNFYQFLEIPNLEFDLEFNLFRFLDFYFFLLISDFFLSTYFLYENIQEKKKNQPLRKILLVIIIIVLIFLLPKDTLVQIIFFISNYIFRLLLKIIFLIKKFKN